MINIYFKTIRSKRFKKINNLRKGSWIHIENATQKDLLFLSENTSLDYDDIIDSRDIYELPRFERQDKDLLLFIRTPVNNPHPLHTETLTIIITEKYFITISPDKNSMIDSIIKNENILASTQQTKFLLNILLKITRFFTLEIRNVHNDMNRRNKDLNDIDREDIKELISSEAVLNQYLSALLPMENMFELISQGNFLKLYKDDNDLFDDVLIEIRQSVDLCKITVKGIVALRDSYQIIFTNRLNKTIKLLTIFTIILTIPTIIGSFWGMNVALPFQNNPFGFIFLVWISIAVSVIVLAIFYWRKWL